jgi:hypothetical protein
VIHHRLGVIQVDFPATGLCELGELLAIHDRIGSGLIGRATLDGDGAGSAVAISSSAADVARATDARTFATSSAVPARSRRRLS